MYCAVCYSFLVFKFLQSDYIVKPTQKAETLKTNYCRKTKTSVSSPSSQSFISRPRAVDYISIYKVILFGFENHLLMFLKVLMTLYLDSYTSTSLPHLRHGRVSTHSPLTIPVTDFEPLHAVCAVFLERLVDCWFVH